MAVAYRYAEDGSHYPEALQALNNIERFGVQALYGRALRSSEVKAMIVTQNILSAYKSRSEAEDWVKWTNDNPQAASLLAVAMRLAYGE